MSHTVIIGGGAIGSFAAYYLRQRGARVTLVDRGEEGGSCSYGNAGLVVPSHFVPLAAPGVVLQGLLWMFDPESPFYIKPRLDPDLLAWIIRFARSSTRRNVERSAALLRDLAWSSQALFRNLQPSADIGLVEDGLLMLYRSEKGRRVNLEEAEMAARLGIEARVLDQNGLRELEPNLLLTATGGVYYPGDAHLSPAHLMSALDGLLRGTGVMLRSSTEVRGFVVRGGRIVSVETDKGPVEGDEFVLAGGSWSPLIAELLGIRLPLQAGKGYSITFERPPRFPSRPLLLTEARVAVTPFRESLRFAGTMELAGIDRTINRRRVDAILKAVPRYIDGLEPMKLSARETWGGLRPVTPDGLPYVGRFRTPGNLIAATGHAMLGITLAPATGKLVAEMVSGQTPSIDIRALSPDRFA